MAFVIQTRTGSGICRSRWGERYLFGGEKRRSWNWPAGVDSTESLGVFGALLRDQDSSRVL